MTFILYADKNKLIVRKRGPLTSGSVGVYPVRFEFSTDWEGLSRTAVFQADGEPVRMLLDESGACSIPREVLVKPGVRLKAGVYGVQGGEIVLPTIWADLGEILRGVTMPDGGTYPPTPELWEQALNGKGDALEYDGLNLSLLAGDKKLSTVQIAGGEGGVPAGGAAGQVLSKVDGVDYNTQWVDPPEGGGGGVDHEYIDNELLKKMDVFSVDPTLQFSANTRTAGGILGVTHPTKILTRAEYEALSEEDKNLPIVYVIQDNTVAPPDSFKPMVYSTEEQVVGTWIDGRPIYQRTVVFDTRSVNGSGIGTVLPEFGDQIEQIVDLFGTASGNNHTNFSVSWYEQIGSQVAIFNPMSSSPMMINGVVTAQYLKKGVVA